MKTFRLISIAHLVALGVAGVAAATTPEEAAQAYAAEDWPAAVSAYRVLAEADPADARSAYRLAVALRHTGETSEAAAWLARAEAGGVPRQFTEVERARLRMAAGDPPGALASLEAAAEAGFTNAAAIETEAQFAALADQPAFAAALDRMRRNAAPCEYDPRFAEFDFWVGRWRVLDAAGTLQGENEIEKGQAGCLLVERWRGASGGSGLSMNYFDPTAEQWVQIWVSPTLQIDIRGGLEDGAMRLTGSLYDLQSSERLPFRGTWTPRPDGVVRQHFEQSRDDGATWQTWFDGYYHPVAVD